MIFLRIMGNIYTVLVFEENYCLALQWFLFWRFWQSSWHSSDWCPSSSSCKCHCTSKHMIWYHIHSIWWNNFPNVGHFSCFRCQKDYSTLWLDGHSCLPLYCSQIVREIDTRGLWMYFGDCKCSSQIVCFV